MHSPHLSGHNPTLSGKQPAPTTSGPDDPAPPPAIPSTILTSPPVCSIHLNMTIININFINWNNPQSICGNCLKKIHRKKPPVIFSYLTYFCKVGHPIDRVYDKAYWTRKIRNTNNNLYADFNTICTKINIIRNILRKNTNTHKKSRSGMRLPNHSGVSTNTAHLNSNCLKTSMKTNETFR